MVYSCGYNQYLILTDSYRNQLHLTGCTCGYDGTGPHGTHEALNILGFKVPMGFIVSAKTFSISHPDNDPEYHQLLKELDSKYIY
ncbi:hypothetical protein AB7942_21865 [Neobacillus sp. BF23-41]|uniref:hypothetical protein n=1 Tax=Neobacillus sp. BF23-41 TaxID=3240280 RepID=UPI0034E43DF5